MEDKEGLKTRRLREGARIGEEFKRDLSVLLEMPDEVIVNIDNYFTSTEPFIRDVREAIRKITDKSNYSGQKIYKVLSIVRFIGGYLENGETINDLMDDLLYENIISDNEHKKASPKFSLLGNFMKSWRARAKEIQYEGSGAPIFSGCSYAADLRLQNKSPFDLYDTEERPLQAEKLIPIGLIEICIKKLGGEESFSFQLSLDEVRDLLKTINSLEKELVYLKDIAQSINKGGE